MADLMLRMLDAFFVPRRTDRRGRRIDQVPTWRRVMAALAFWLTLASLVVLFIWWRNHWRARGPDHVSGLGLPAAVVSDAGLRESILLDAVGRRPECRGNWPHGTMA